MTQFPCITKQRRAAELSAAMVFGERNSGTNLVMELLRKNFPALRDSPGDQIKKYGFPYGWKHAVPMMVAAPDTTLAVGVFRNPCDWLRSMHRRPWHVAPALRDLPFERFIRAEWATEIDEVNFGVPRDDPRWGAELQWDRHPLTGQRFANICALRNVKTTGFLSLPQRFNNCLLVRHEDVSAAPEAFVSAVSAYFRIGRLRKFAPVETRRGRAGEGAFKPVSYAPLDDSDRRFVWSELDVAQEARLGYKRPD